MSDFTHLKNAVSQRVGSMLATGLFCTAAKGEDLWQTYLASFPEGSNPMFRKRTEHDCSCCRQFVKAFGNVVTIVDGKLVSIWDTPDVSYPYVVVAEEMARAAKAQPVVDVFLHYDRHVGTDQNYEPGHDGGPLTWDHFHVNLPKSNSGRDTFCVKKDIPTRLGDLRTTLQVFLRSLTELTAESLETADELIAQGSLYRGNEFAANLKEFRKLKTAFDKLSPAEQELYAWAQFDKQGPAIARIRNTAFGTLLVDLSEGLDLEQAVRKYEKMMAPTNYKRPTALVTQAMVDRARADVAELGLTSSLERRYARLEDISVNDILFADRTARKVMKDAFDTVQTKAATRSFDKVDMISIKDFIKDVLPKASTIEVMFENKHQSNLVSLVAPVDPQAKPLFKWDNGFSWSYNGDVTDSVKERVKAAGGNVTGDLCCRLAWYNFDDLDFHMHEPGPSTTSLSRHIYYGDKGPSAAGGRLDVDMNASSGNTRTPVENIFYGDRTRMKEGKYNLYVDQFSRRESKDVGFEVEIDFQGEVWNFTYDKAVSGSIAVATMEYTHAGGLKMISNLTSKRASKNVWSIDTEKFHRVNVMMNSPNHWEGEKGVGNRHYFFMLDGCLNEGQARGFYNEFLNADLDKHRKVLEIVGSKMKTVESAGQLSGLGFSDTRRAEILVKVTGRTARVLKVVV